jgi:hypothetical protein
MDIKVANISEVAAEYVLLPRDDVIIGFPLIHTEASYSSKPILWCIICAAVHHHHVRNHQ